MSVPGGPRVRGEVGALRPHGRRAPAARGVVGRASVDFAAALGADGTWSVHALEVNLRKGGTTHPYSALRNLVPGRYDDDGARWITADGSERSYWSTDNLLDPSWQGLRPSVVIDQLAAEGLEFDIEAGTGVVLHMLSCLAIDGRLGLTAIGRTPEHTADLYEAAAAAISSAAGRGRVRLGRNQGERSLCRAPISRVRMRFFAVPGGRRLAMKARSNHDSSSTLTPKTTTRRACSTATLCQRCPLPCRTPAAWSGRGLASGPVGPMTQEQRGLVDETEPVAVGIEAIERTLSPWSQLDRRELSAAACALAGARRRARRWRSTGSPGSTEMAPTAQPANRSRPR